MQKTIDILLNLTAKPKGAQDLIKEFKTLEGEAAKVSKEMSRWGSGSANLKPMQAQLAAIKKRMAEIHAEAKKETLAKSLQKAAEQANKTRERMEKMAQVGQRLALAGGAIVAPFALALKKYTDNYKNTSQMLEEDLQKRQEEFDAIMKNKDASSEEKVIAQNKLRIAAETLEYFREHEKTAGRMLELQKSWEATQVRIGRVAADILLPSMEKALVVVNKIAAFAEKHPGAVQAALTIGGSLVVIGGFLSTAASIVSTLATVQGIAAGLGIGGGAAAGGGMAAGLSAAIAPLLTAVAPIAIIAAQVVAIAALVALVAEATRVTMNTLLGTETTWSDIGTTFKQLMAIVKFGFTNLGTIYKTLFTSFWTAVGNGFKSIASALSNLGSSISAALGFKSKPTTRDSGGYIGRGLFQNVDGRREFVMSNQTTRAAESMIGGTMTQQRLLAALGGSRRVSYNDNRRIDGGVSPEMRRVLRNDTLSAIAGAL